MLGVAMQLLSRLMGKRKKKTEKVVRTEHNKDP